MVAIAFLEGESVVIFVGVVVSVRPGEGVAYFKDKVLVPGEINRYYRGWIIGVGTVSVSVSPLEAVIVVSIAVDGI